MRGIFQFIINHTIDQVNNIWDAYFNREMNVVEFNIFKKRLAYFYGKKLKQMNEKLKLRPSWVLETILTVKFISL